jgi:uncharacterized membrane protein YozB (DUF420 family)
MTIPFALARRWRLAFVAAGLTMAVGGPMHPESDAEDPLRQELATMASGDTWVLSHSLIALGTALLAAGLWLAVRHGSWPSATHRALRFAAIALSVYVVETIFHLATAVDVDALRDGEVAPVAFAHIALSVVLYPVSGLALAWLSVTLLRSVPFPHKLLAVAGLAGGLLHAVSVPLTLLFPDTELTPAFAGAGMLMAAWALGTGIAGFGPATRRVPSPSTGTTAPVPVAASMVD